MNQNNNQQQQSQFKQVHHPAPVSETDGRDPKRPGGNTAHAVLFAIAVTRHYAADCTLRFREYPTIVFNCEKLNVDDSARVPVTSYNQARRLVEADRESKITHEFKKAKSKN